MRSPFCENFFCKMPIMMWNDRSFHSSTDKARARSVVRVVLDGAPEPLRFGGRLGTPNTSEAPRPRTKTLASAVE